MNRDEIELTFCDHEMQRKEQSEHMKTVWSVVAAYAIHM